jgi:HSP20 family protein
MLEENPIMPITRWDLFREPVSLQTRVSYLFRDLNDAAAPVTPASFAPAVDVYEDTKKVVLKLEIPGVDQKDLDIRVENRTLTVKGERKFEAEEQKQNFHRIERRYGTFFRAFTLPSTVDTESIQASYSNGVLKLDLAKKPEAQPKQIKINVGGESAPLGKTESGTIEPAKTQEPEMAGTR